MILFSVMGRYLDMLCLTCPGKILNMQLDCLILELVKENKTGDINLVVVSIKIFMGLNEII